MVRPGTTRQVVSRYPLSVVEVRERAKSDIHLDTREKPIEAWFRRLRVAEAR